MYRYLLRNYLINLPSPKNILNEFRMLIIIKQVALKSRTLTLGIL
jgi:hypothetical protein